MSKPADREDMEEEELDERDENIDDLEIHLDAKELRQIEQIRRDEIFKQTLTRQILLLLRLDCCLILYWAQKC